VLPREGAVLEGSGSPAAGWRRFGSLGSAIAVALLPKCPACWSAYAGLSSLLGLSFVVEARYLLPLTAALLAFALAALAVQARRRRSYGPCALATAAAVLTLAGKFALESDALLYTGLGSLLCASLWSSCRFGWLSRSSFVRRAVVGSSSRQSSRALASASVQN